MRASEALSEFKGEPRRISRRWRRTVTLHAVCILASVIIVFPLYYGITYSLLNLRDAYSWPPLLFPVRTFFQNYRDAWVSAKIYHYIINSFIVASAVTLGQLITSCLSAYAFSFFRFRGRNLLFFLFIATMFVPSEACLIPNYLTMRDLNLLDSYVGLILPFLASSLGTFLMRQYFLTIPRDIHEATLLDGIGKFGFLFRILIPLSLPALATLGIYTFMSSWNMYTWPLIITNTAQKRTVQIGIAILRFEDSMNYSLVLAGVVLVLLPSLMALALGQKYIIKGLTAGAVKG